MILERELKLFIPTSQKEAVAAAIQQLTGHYQLRLAAQYFDTKTAELAQQHAALRLRLEGDQWVQTVKIKAGDEFSFEEYNHPRPHAQLDLSLYDNSPAAALFTHLKQPLELRYETKIQRTVADIAVNNGRTHIELALDIGVIKANALHDPVCELELELKHGEMDDVFATAEQWRQRFNLRWEHRTKAQRGAQLAQLTLTQQSGSKLAGHKRL